MGLDGHPCITCFEQSEMDKTFPNANVVDNDEPLAWLFYFARFLALFPWKDCALDPTGTATLKQRGDLANLVFLDHKQF